MWSNPQFSADLVIFTEEILNEKLHFLVQCHFLKILGSKSSNQGYLTKISELSEGKQTLAEGVEICGKLYNAFNLMVFPESYPKHVLVHKNVLNINTILSIGWFFSSSEKFFLFTMKTSYVFALQKKSNFQLRIPLVNVTEFVGNCRFGHIYWRNVENFIFCAMLAVS